MFDAERLVELIGGDPRDTRPIVDGAIQQCNGEAFAFARAWLGSLDGQDLPDSPADPFTSTSLVDHMARGAVEIAHGSREVRVLWNARRALQRSGRSLTPEQNAKVDAWERDARGACE